MTQDTQEKISDKERIAEEMAAEMASAEKQVTAPIEQEKSDAPAEQAETEVATGTNIDSASVFSAVDNLASQLQTIETFFARRFDEISMEINATSQQVDMAEEGIVGKFTDVLEVLKAISFSGDGKTPANAGVELDAVVDITEDATNKILDQAQRTTDIVSDANIHWEDAEVRQKTIEQIEANMDEIMMACSFQDITGQRIRTTLANLHEIEERLNSALGKMGIVVEVAAPEDQKTWVANQDDIDSLFE